MGMLSQLKGPIAGLLVSVLAFIGVLLVGLLSLFDTLTSPGVSIGSLIGTIIPYVIGLVIVAVIGLGFIVWGLYRVVNSLDQHSDIVQNRYVQMALAKFGTSKWGRRLGLLSSAGSVLDDSGGHGPGGQPGQQSGGEPGQQSGGQSQGQNGSPGQR